MKCIHCGAEIPDESAFCMECGKKVVEAPTGESPKHKSSVITMVIAAVLVLIALAAAIWYTAANRKSPTNEPTASAGEPVSGTGTTAPAETSAPTVPADGDPDTVACKGSYTVDEEQMALVADAVVATMGEDRLTNAQLQIYFWMQYYNFVENYGAYAGYLGLDATAPLDTQLNPASDGLTWQQFFLEGALDNWHLYTALSREAEAADFRISQEMQDYFDNLEQSLTEAAAQSGFADVQEMIRNDMGPGCGYEDYLHYLTAYYTGSEYFGSLYDSFAPEASDVEGYFEEHEAEYAESGLTRDVIHVDVRHILINPEGGTTDENGQTIYSDDEWDACRQKAQQVLDGWLAGEKTEDSFALLANEHSQDPGSNTGGGLYTDVTEGQMVEEFNDWCFDASRMPGDYGLVKTRFGYHIMYFSGSHEAWFEQAERDLITELARKRLEKAREDAPISIDYNAIAIGLPNFDEEAVQ
ncbi:MAG: peptidylprolyl isomerase [Firmicutes bacterium]|nr:peptidylprolyl isomerase [Bacillota bacterium]